MRVTVIGSGIVGASAAYHLSSRGADVVVVDADLEGQATAAGAGIVCPWVDHPEDDAWYALARSGARHYPELVEALGEDLGYERVGALLVAGDPAELEPVRALLARRHAEAPEMGEVTVVPDPARLFPPLAEGLTAIHVPGAARVDGRAVRDALLRAAVRQGAALRTGVATLTAGGEVLLSARGEVPLSAGDEALLSAGDAAGTSGAHPAPGGPGRADVAGGDGSWRQAAPLSGDDTGSRTGAWEREARGPAPEDPAGDGAPAETVATRESLATRETVATRETIAADMVVVAAGAWSGAVCRPLGVEVPVFPRRGQIVHAALDGVDTAGWPIVLPHVGPYLLGFPGSRVVVGATVEDVGFVPRVTMGGLEEVLRAGLRLAPGLAGATVTETRVGLRPVRAGGPPLLCRVGERVVLATGLSAYGLTAGPFAGLLAARLALGEPSPLDLAPYRLPS
ncbi:NAD(P)/FAD-dependent oxidoreductase [Nonomuraea rhodomycinica]|uniref:FAD-binding oxidoreductase n=1 Tax=Nonomuraea rhodomycinica TaxID=1712872 RepID=A0A7Y6IIP6_9ACTN|nr:FAD-dependent oxidoreductase [Nonomuraea rhodomycinica]NUW38953.1 FAD-binding oxidoreductase [Nonomuraea rhodomycinica]